MFASRLSTLGAALLSAATFMSATAATAQDFEPRTEIVKFADLDLGRASGLSRLDTRLKFAARRVCYIGLNDIRSLDLERQCRNDVLNDARTRVAALIKVRGGTEVALSR